MKYLLLIIIFGFRLANAVEITTAENILIQADKVSADLKNEVVVYSGNVKVVKSGMTFQADSIEEHRQSAALVKLIASGSPTVFINELASNGELYQGTATGLQYLASKGEITLVNFKLLDTAGNTNSGHKGVYLLPK